MPNRRRENMMSSVLTSTFASTAVAPCAVLVVENECNYEGVDDCCERCPTDNGNTNNDDDESKIPTSPPMVDDDDDDDDAPNPKITRLEISASIFLHMSESEKQTYIRTFVPTYHCDDITTVHISGQQLDTVLSTEQIMTIMKAIHELSNITEYFCFHGGCPVFTSDMIGQSLPPQLQILILWHFPSLSEESNQFAAALRLQSSLQRLTLNFTCRHRSSTKEKRQRQQSELSWGCLDVVIMACACMEQLRVLQIRCAPTSDYHIAAKMIQQQESIVTPEAMAVLLNSRTITQLYLENCGLIDDHMDEVYNELPKNKALVTLDLKGNMFTEDCLYTTGRLLPIAPCQLQCFDISGVDISNDAGMAVAKGMVHQNYTIQSIELEGTIQRYQDEFDIPIGHTNTKWMQDIAYQLRLNRAYQVAYESSVSSSSSNNGEEIAAAAAAAATFVEKQNVVSKDASSFVGAVSSVSDNESCIYHFLRTYPNHCSRLTVPVSHVEPIQ